jgi:hypothetical protein
MEEKRSSLTRLVDLLKKQGSTEGEIADFLTKLSNEIAETFYSSSLSVLTEDDLKAIEAAKIPEQANFEIRQRYYNRTGKNPDHIASQMYEDFAAKFIDSYHQHQNGPPSQIQTSGSNQPLADPNFP